MQSFQATDDRKTVSISATATLPISAEEAFELHVQEHHAARFRDIQTYSEYHPMRDGTIRVGFPGGIGCTVVRMILNPRQGKDEYTVDFHSEDSCLLDVVGRWTLTPMGLHTCHVALAQTLRLRMPLSTLIPLKYIASRRVSRCMEDIITYAQDVHEKKNIDATITKNTTSSSCCTPRVADWLSSQFSSS
jgi:hypothetical protein